MLSASATRGRGSRAAELPARTGTEQTAVRAGRRLALSRTREGRGTCTDTRDQRLLRFSILGDISNPLPRLTRSGLFQRPPRDTLGHSESAQEQRAMGEELPMGGVERDLPAHPRLTAAQGDRQSPSVTAAPLDDTEGPGPHFTDQETEARWRRRPHICQPLAATPGVLSATSQQAKGWWERLALNSQIRKQRLRGVQSPAHGFKVTKLGKPGWRRLGFPVRGTFCSSHPGLAGTATKPRGPGGPERRERHKGAHGDAPLDYITPSRGAAPGCHRGSQGGPETHSRPGPPTSRLGSFQRGNSWRRQDALAFLSPFFFFFF
ncbi:PREDICTED: uncharacterized protein LOC106147971 [Chinchilla lanigera]|uniref:uncharacterized protein LOC106147971 n=1 Tax=Chinchilla lanigera TaxID=34839 RepID=UPI00069833C7|nr:PREDICTED: uncharacterized protein LOC106147971 [Chinchilla lanigera]